MVRKVSMLVFIILSLASWVQAQLQNHPDELWEDGVQDYLNHAKNIMVIDLKLLTLLYILYKRFLSFDFNCRKNSVTLLTG